MDVTISELLFHRICQIYLSGGVRSLGSASSSLNEDCDNVASTLFILFGKMVDIHIKDALLVIGCACAVSSDTGRNQSHFSHLPIITDWCCYSLDIKSDDWVPSSWKFVSAMTLRHILRRFIAANSSDDVPKKPVSIRSGSKKAQAGGQLKDLIPFLITLTEFVEKCLMQIPDSVHASCVDSFLDDNVLKRLFFTAYFCDEIQIPAFSELMAVCTSRLKITTPSPINQLAISEAYALSSIDAVLHEGQLVTTETKLMIPSADVLAVYVQFDVGQDKPRLRSHLINLFRKTMTSCKNEVSTTLSVINYTIKQVAGMIIADLQSAQLVFTQLSALLEASTAAIGVAEEEWSSLRQVLMYHYQSASAVLLLLKHDSEALKIPLTLAALYDAPPGRYQIFYDYLENVKSMVGPQSLESDMDGILAALRAALAVLRIFGGRNCEQSAMAGPIFELTKYNISREYVTSIDDTNGTSTPGYKEKKAFVKLIDVCVQCVDYLKGKYEASIHSFCDTIFEVFFVDLSIWKEVCVVGSIQECLHRALEALPRGYSICVSVSAGSFILFQTKILLPIYMM